MLGVFAVVTIAAGTLMACVPDRFGLPRERGELVGGFLIILGLVLIGVGLSPLFR